MAAKGRWLGATTGTLQTTKPGHPNGVPGFGHVWLRVCNLFYNSPISRGAVKREKPANFFTVDQNRPPGRNQLVRSTLLYPFKDDFCK